MSLGRADHTIGCILFLGGWRAHGRFYWSLRTLGQEQQGHTEDSQRKSDEEAEGKSHIFLRRGPSGSRRDEEGLNFSVVQDWSTLYMTPYASKL